MCSTSLDLGAFQGTAGLASLGLGAFLELFALITAFLDLLAVVGASGLALVVVLTGSQLSAVGFASLELSAVKFVMGNVSVLVFRDPLFNNLGITFASADL